MSNSDITSGPASSSGVSGSIWWQTALHVVISAVAFVPILVLCGVGYLLLKFLDGESFGIYYRGLQCGIAACASLYVPTLFLKRTNGVIAAAIWCTMVVSLFLALLALSFAVGTSPKSFWDWVENVVSLAGVIFGAVAFAFERPGR